MLQFMRPQRVGHGFQQLENNKFLIDGCWKQPRWRTKTEQEKEAALSGAPADPLGGDIMQRPSETRRQKEMGTDNAGRLSDRTGREPSRNWNVAEVQEQGEGSPV